MKPDIIKYNDLRAFKGYVGVICRCGNVLHIKNNPKKARQLVFIECPCGAVIETIYMSEE